MHDKGSSLRISIIIPVYNEALYLGACLDAIQAQTVAPDEVLVIDNNSSDESRAIAANYPFVRIVNEISQGVLQANFKGFSEAGGDLIGRIDADSRIADTWVADALSFFDSHASFSAVTGKCYYFDFPFPRLVSALHAFFYQYLQYLISGTSALWAANMVVRRTAWDEILPALHNTAWTNEDLDLTLTLRDHGLKIDRRREMIAHVSLMRGNLRPIHVFNYLLHWPANYWRNRLYVRSFFVVIIVVTVFGLTLPVLIIHSGYRAVWPNSLHYS